MTKQEKAQAAKLLVIVTKFITDHNIDCAETIYQVDSVIENAYELIEEICSVVGYAEYEEE